MNSVKCFTVVFKTLVLTLVCIAVVGCSAPVAVGDYEYRDKNSQLLLLRIIDSQTCLFVVRQAEAPANGTAKPSAKGAIVSPCEYKKISPSRYRLWFADHSDNAISGSGVAEEDSKIAEVIFDHQPNQRTLSISGDSGTVTLELKNKSNE